MVVNEFVYISYNIFTNLVCTRVYTLTTVCPNATGGGPTGGGSTGGGSTGGGSTGGSLTIHTITTILTALALTGVVVMLMN